MTQYNPPPSPSPPRLPASLFLKPTKHTNHIPQGTTLGAEIAGAWKRPLFVGGWAHSDDSAMSSPSSSSQEPSTHGGLVRTISHRTIAQPVRPPRERFDINPLALLLHKTEDAYSLHLKNFLQKRPRCRIAGSARRCHDHPPLRRISGGKHGTKGRGGGRGCLP